MKKCTINIKYCITKLYRGTSALVYLSSDIKAFGEFPNVVKTTL